MGVDVIPLWACFLGTILIVMLSMEVGHRLGALATRRSQDEKEAHVSGVAGAVLGLTAFMLAFTFGIAADRYDARKALVREDANALRLTYLRAAFLPEPDRGETRRLLKRYLDLRLAFAESGNFEPRRVQAVRADTDRIQRRLWDIAVANGESNLDPGIAALYVEGLNDVFAINANRVAIALQGRIPKVVWIVLFGLVALGMASMGYHTGIAGSRRSKVTLVLAVSFALVVALIVALDRPGHHLKVTQQPLADLQRFMDGSG